MLHRKRHREHFEQPVDNFLERKMSEEKKDLFTVDWVRVEARQRRLEEWVKEWREELDAEQREHNRLLSEHQEKGQ